VQCTWFQLLVASEGVVVYNWCDGCWLDWTAVCRVIFDDTGVAQLHQVLVSDDLSNPDGLAYDWIHHNLYWTDSGNDRIEVLSLRNAVRTWVEDGVTWRRTLINTDLEEPRAIVVDPRPKYRYCYHLPLSPSPLTGNI